jgi:D-alanyl-D-alanine dipeptidase
MKLWTLCCVAVVCVGAALVAGAREPRALKKSKQMVVVTTADWNATTGTLRRYERVHRKWVAVGDPVAVVVGKNGMGWGAGLETRKVVELGEADDPVKKEGDKKSPAGVFRLSEAFGFAEKAPAGWKMPYVHLTPTVECVDDARSKFYNRVVDRAAVQVDWTSSEKMAAEDPYYRWGLVVDHNADPVRPGAGSCVFLHIWDGPGGTTAGCTAMAGSQVEALLAWLDPEARPVLVEMPVGKYDKAQHKWRLPRLGAQ